MGLDYKTKTRQEIDYINNNFKMSEVVDRVTGIRCDRSGFLICPIHGSSKSNKNCSINVKKGDNIITCWSEQCLKGSGVFNFLDKYLREVKGINDWKEVYKAIDSILGTNLYIKPVKEEKATQEVINDFTHEFKINKYCNEVEKEVKKIIFEKKCTLVNAGTGLGKTYMLTEIGKDISKIVDNVIYLTARRSLVEEIAEKYNYKSFMGNDFLMPDSPVVVATTHKAYMINYTLQTSDLGMSEVNSNELEFYNKNYGLIIDECHLLHACRGIIGNIEEINELIQNAEFVIFTSANTKHFYKAFKEEYKIENYINIERKEKAYNLDNLDIIRLESNKDSKPDWIIEKLKNDKNKILIINNNIKENKEICEKFKEVGRVAVEINSKNKDSEAYENIIKKSLLTCDVTICTSVLDTGVNINTKGVTTMILADSMQFDDISIIQGFARARSLTGGNKGILVLHKKKEEVKRIKVSDINEFIEFNTEIANKNSVRFNEHMFNYYDCNSYEEYKIIWNLLRENELYNISSSMLKIKAEKFNANPRMVVDHTMIYEVSRKQHLKDNYYINHFILELLKDIDTKQISIKNEVFASKKEKEVTEKIQGFKNLITDILENENYLNELVEAYTSETDVKDSELLTQLFEEDEKKMAELNRTIRNIIKLTRKTSKNINIDIKDFIEEVLKAYILVKKVDTNRRIKELKYIIYNQLYPDKIEYMELDGIGDLYYSIIRESADMVSSRRGIITDRINMAMVNEYCIRNGYTPLQGGEFKNKGKKINLNKISNNINSLIKSIYNVNESGRINTLIKKIK